MSPASLAEAWAWLDAVPVAAGEPVDVAAAAGRVLASPVQAATDWPDCDRAAANGYEVRAAETDGASPYNPVAPAGGIAPISSGHALSARADAVLGFESVDEAGLVVAPIAPGEGIIRAGDQVRAGAVLFEAGHRLRAVDVALLLCAGVEQVLVCRLPRVHLSIADKRAGADALTPLLTGLLAQDGAVTVGRGEDLMLIAGQCGFGCDDDAPARFVAAGGRIVHRGVAIRPGAVSSLGWRRATPVLLLPGEPLACLAAYRVLAGRLVRRMAGFAEPAARMATLRRKIASGVGYADFIPVRLSGAQAEPVGAGLAGAARADGYVLVPPPSEGFAAGSEVFVHPVDSWPS